jgi:hypothetical protein
MELREPNTPCLEQCATSCPCMYLGIVSMRSPSYDAMSFFLIPSLAPSRLLLLHIRTMLMLMLMLIAHRPSPCYSCCAVSYCVVWCRVESQIACPSTLHTRYCYYYGSVALEKTRHPILLPSIHIPAGLAALFHLFS